MGNEQVFKFWWRSGSRIRIRIAIVVRRALADVCTVPVILVIIILNGEYRKTDAYKKSSGDEIANVNFYAVRPEATRNRRNNAK